MYRADQMQAGAGVLFLADVLQDDMVHQNKFAMLGRSFYSDK
jgi:hypothetical protein